MPGRAAQKQVLVSLALTEASPRARVPLQIPTAPSAAPSSQLSSRPERTFCFTEMGPPHHHPGHRMPHPGINEHPPWGGPQHPDFGPPPHGFNGQPPHMRRQGPPHINHDDPSLVPNVPYFDLPAGLMAPLVKVTSPWRAPSLLVCRFRGLHVRCSFLCPVNVTD